MHSEGALGYKSGRETEIPLLCLAIGGNVFFLECIIDFVELVGNEKPGKRAR